MPGEMKWKYEMLFGMCGGSVRNVQWRRNEIQLISAKNVSISATMKIESVAISAISAEI